MRSPSTRSREPSVRVRRFLVARPGNVNYDASRAAASTRSRGGFALVVPSRVMDTPASLLERLRQPAAPAAWNRFVELYTPVLYAWTRRLGLQPADAADLVQDVFTILVQKLPTFQYDKQKSFHA